MWSETEEALGPFLSLLMTMGMFSKHPPDLLWSEDKEAQVIEGSALVVLV